MNEEILVRNDGRYDYTQDNNIYDYEGNRMHYSHVDSVNLTRFCLKTLEDCTSIKQVSQVRRMMKVTDGRTG